MNTLIGGVWKNIESFVRISGVMTRASTLVKVGTSWVGYFYKTAQVSVGDTGLSAGYPPEITFVYAVPSTHRVLKLRSEAYVYQHTDGLELARVNAFIDGWNGSSWVRLATGPGAESLVQGQTVYDSVEYTLPNLNTPYSQFRFGGGGSSFRRGVAGYLKEYYEYGSI